MQPARARLIAIAGAIIAGATLLTGVYGWLNDSPAVLLLAATPLFAVLALSFGVLSRQRAGQDLKMQQRKMQPESGALPETRRECK